MGAAQLNNKGEKENLTNNILSDRTDSGKKRRNDLIPLGLALAYIGGGLLSFVFDSFAPYRIFSFDRIFTLIFVFLSIGSGILALRRIYWPAVVLAFLHSPLIIHQLFSEPSEFKTIKFLPQQPFFCVLVVMWFFVSKIKWFFKFPRFQPLLGIILLAGAFTVLGIDVKDIFEVVQVKYRLQQPQKPDFGKIPADRLSFLDFRGNPFSPSSAAKCVLLDFSSKFCVPCREEAKRLPKIQDDFSARGSFRVFVVFPACEMRNPVQVAELFGLDKQMVGSDEKDFSEELGVYFWPSQFILFQNHIFPIYPEGKSQEERNQSLRNQIEGICFPK